MGCVLCGGLNNVRTHRWNRALVNSGNFVVVPSLGALLEGWVLIVPKQHAIATGELPDSLVDELYGLKNDVAVALSEAYQSPVCVFEHGPNRERCAVGCGVDHAHLHVVPITFDLREAVAPYLPADTRWQNATLRESQRAFAEGRSYLYCEQPLGFGYIATNENFGSQLFRRAISARMGVPNEFNWRDNPQVPNVDATIRGARVWVPKLRSCLNTATA
jgi:ATP adenylyltransferase